MKIKPNPTLAVITPWVGKMVWDNHSIVREDQWLINLSEADINNIDSGVKTAMLSAKPMAELTKNDFKFAAFGQQLLEIRTDILDGKGFAVLRGLPKDWSDEKLVQAYWGIGRWLGDPVSQNAKGHLLGHVIDRRSSPSAGIRMRH